jgi:hypothetical protein
LPLYLGLSAMALAAVDRILPVPSHMRDIAVNGRP